MQNNSSDTLKKMRLSKEKKTCEMAEMLGVSIHTYRKYEEFTRQPSKKVMDKMCEVFECDYNTIMCVFNNHNSIANQMKLARK